MSTALRIQTEPEITRLDQFYHAAGIHEFASWVPEVGLDKEPFAHQIGDLNYMAAYMPRCGLWNEMGTGKSLSSQAFAIWLAGFGNKVVVVMPPVLVPQYLRSLHTTFIGLNKHLKYEVFQGAPKERQADMDRWEVEGWPDILIMSYKMFAGKGHKGDSLWDSRTPPEAATFSWHVLQMRGYTCVIVDEAHAVKTQGTAIHNAVQGFVQPRKGNDSNGLVLLTGTPIVNTIEDAFGLIHLLDPNRYGSKRGFERTHVQLDYGAPFRKVLGFVNLDSLYAALYARGRRVLKKDVNDLPPKILTEIPVNLSDEHMRLYKKLMTQKVLEIGDRLIDATQAGALYQLAQQIIVTPERFAEKPPKENMILETLDQVLDSLGGHKVLVYCWYTATVESLRSRYADRNPGVLYGRTTDRDTQKEKFILDPKCQLMIANISSGGFGVDGWQKVCSHVVFVEMIPVPGTFQQAVDRLHRTGQTECVNVYLLTAEKTISVMLRNRLTQKDDEANQVTRDRKTLLRDLMGEEGLKGELK